MASHASRAVNISLTVRNWLMGYYIVEFEQNGEDRAAYGDKLFSRLASELKDLGLTGVSLRELRRYRTFYFAYPQIREALPPEFQKLLPDKDLGLDEHKTAAPTPFLDTQAGPRYQLQLPSKETLESQIQRERERLQAADVEVES